MNKIREDETAEFRLLRRPPEEQVCQRERERLREIVRV